MNKTVAMLAFAIAILIAGCGSEPKFTIENKIYPKPEKCVVMIFPMSKKDKVKEWYQAIARIYPEYRAFRTAKNNAECETDNIKKMGFRTQSVVHIGNIKSDMIWAQHVVKLAVHDCFVGNESFRDKVEKNGNYEEIYEDYQIEKFEKVVPKYKEPIVLFGYALVPYRDLTIYRAWYLEYSPGKAVTWTLE